MCIRLSNKCYGQHVRKDCKSTETVTKIDYVSDFMVYNNYLKLFCNYFNPIVKRKLLFFLWGWALQKVLHSLRRRGVGDGKKVWYVGFSELCAINGF